MSVTAFEVSESLAGAIASAAPSIVRVDARAHVPSTGIVWSADGVIVTAAHSVQRDGGIELHFDDGSSSSATLAGRDESTDVAVLRVQKGGLRPPRWFDAGKVRVGHLVLAAARPGRSVRATAGIVSALGPEWRTGDGARIDARIDVDASLPPGFSGGPLIDASGSFIGMNTSRVIRTGTTIPHATLVRVVDAILAHGFVGRPPLGIAVHPVEAGLLVISVKTGSAAERAGVLVGDILRMHSPRELRERLQDEGSLRIEIVRGGTPKTIEILKSK